MSSKLDPDYTIPVFGTELQPEETGLLGFEELLTRAHEEMQAWFKRQVNRNHYKWSEERIVALRTKLEPTVQELGLTPEVRQSLQELKIQLTVDCQAFAVKVIATIMEHEQKFAKDETETIAKATKPVASKKQKDLRLLGMEGKQALCRLLEGGLSLSTPELAKKFSDLTDIGWNKHYGKKMNHVLHEYPELFLKEKKKWKLDAAAAAATEASETPTAAALAEHSEAIEPATGPAMQVASPGN